MKRQNKQEWSVEVEKKNGSTLIRIGNVNVEQFEEAYLLAEDLLEKSIMLEKKSRAEKSVKSLWVKEKGKTRLSDIVGQSTHRLALSLFMVYPKSKALEEILEETGLSRPTVYRYLGGHRKSVADYFDGESGEYRLTEKGFQWVLNELVPFLAQQTGFSRNTS